MKFFTSFVECVQSRHHHYSHLGISHESIFFIFVQKKTIFLFRNFEIALNLTSMSKLLRTVMPLYTLISMRLLET